MPKSWLRCSTNMSHSSNVPSSSSSSMRSRAVSLPLACCAAMRFWPPPRRARARLASSCWMMSCMVVFRRLRSWSSTLGAAARAAKAPSSRRAATDTGSAPGVDRGERRRRAARAPRDGRGTRSRRPASMRSQSQARAWPRRRACERAAARPAPRGTPRRRPRTPRRLVGSARSSRITRGCQRSPPSRRADEAAAPTSIWPTARAAAAGSRSALLTTTRSASSITPFLIACRSSPALGSCSSTNMSVMPATAVSLWPTPTVSTMTTS